MATAGWNGNPSSQERDGPIRSAYLAAELQELAVAIHAGRFGGLRGLGIFRVARSLRAPGYGCHRPAVYRAALVPASSTWPGAFSGMSAAGSAAGGP